MRLFVVGLLYDYYRLLNYSDGRGVASRHLVRGRHIGVHTVDVLWRLYRGAGGACKVSTPSWAS